VAAVAGAPPPEIAITIYERSEGNPFFAEELLAAAARGDEMLPRVLHDALLQRVARLDAVSRSVLRMAAAAGRDVCYALLAAVISLPEHQLLESLEQAVEHGVLVADQHAGAYRFRHALLAEVVYATLLPGEREAVHGRLARALGDNPTLVAARTATGEAAQHWASAGRPVEALVASVQAAGEAEAVSGLAEALQHLERAIELWEQVPTAEELTGLELPDLLGEAAELADLTGNGRRAVALTNRAIELVDEDADPRRVGLLYERLGSYLLPWGAREEGLAAFERAVELVPAEPPSADRARVLSALGNALTLSWRHEDSKAVCEEAIAIAEVIEDDRPALRAMSVLGIDLCYLGQPAEGLRILRDAQMRARERGRPRDVTHSDVMLCELLVATGQLPDVAQTALEGLEIARRTGLERSYGILLAGYAGEAFLEAGDWSRADEILAAALSPEATYWSHYPHLLRAQLAIGRGELAAAREHLEAGAQGAREPTSAARHARLTAELALWERRPEEAANAVAAGLRGPKTGAAFQRTRLAAVGVQAEAERRQLASIARDTAAVGAARRRARRLLAEARRSSEEVAAVNPDAAAWRAVAEAEHSHVEDRPSPERWQAAVTAWDALERPYPAACCRWRLAEALVAGGRSTEATVAARAAHRVASRLGARARFSASSSSSPSAPGSTFSDFEPRMLTNLRQRRARSGSPRASAKCSNCSPAATRIGRSPPSSSSASRQRASTSRTSSASSTYRVGSTRHKSRNGLHRRRPRRPNNDRPCRQVSVGPWTRRSVVSCVNTPRTQNGHIRNDTRDVLRRTACAANRPISRRRVSRVIARVRA
jgi:tetratricopeptide (TPR) repeat protein